MRVALIQPPSPFLLRSNVHPPLGLWYLGAALQDAGHDVVYCDLGLGDALPRDVEVWCVTGTTPQMSGMRAAIEQAGEIPVIVGGPAATLEPQRFVEMGADLVIRGEGEQVLPQVLGRDAGPIVDAERIYALDSVAYPDRSQAHRYEYRIMDRRGDVHDATTAITSRGCPHRCAFCSHALWGQRYTARSAENVLGEMWELRERWGYDAVQFYDDSFAISERRAVEIVRGLRSLGMTWRCFIRGDQCTAGLLRTFAEAGCAEIGLGVESGAQTILDNIQKDETVEQQEQAIYWAMQAGIRVKAFLIVGLPGETWATIDETARFLERAQPTDIDVSVLQIYPGSPIHDDPDAYDVERTAAPMWYKGTPGEYSASHRTAALSADDLVAARDYLEARYKRQGVAA